MKAKLFIMAAMMAMTVTANAMPYGIAREEALFLSDKMAYELDLTEAQYEAVYEINLDYLLNIDERFDVFGLSWSIRNRDLRHVLTSEQYDNFMGREWFYRPVAWNPNGWSFVIYNRYNHGHLFRHHPAVFVSFRGGHNHRGASFYSGFHFERPTRTFVNGTGRHCLPIIIDGRPHSVPPRVAPANRPHVIHIDGRPHHVSDNAPVHPFGINRR